MTTTVSAPSLPDAGQMVFPVVCDYSHRKQGFVTVCPHSPHPAPHVPERASLSSVTTIYEHRRLPEVPSQVSLTPQGPASLLCLAATSAMLSLAPPIAPPAHWAGKHGIQTRGLG